MEIQLIETIIQGGAVGICVLLIIKDWRQSKMYNKTMNNHLQHTEDAQIRVASSNENLAVALTKLTDRIEGCPGNKLNK